MNQFSLVSFILRSSGAALIVFATFNPSGYSYYNWVNDSLHTVEPAIEPPQAFVGVVLLIGWCILIRSTLLSLGTVGLILASAFIGTLVWMMTSYGLFDADTPTSISWVALVSLCTADHRHVLVPYPQKPQWSG